MKRPEIDQLEQVLDRKLLELQKALQKRFPTPPSQKGFIKKILRHLKQKVTDAFALLRSWLSLH